MATSQPLATEAGVRILRAGGNAADAAVAAAAVLGVTEPTSCGLGGDCFALFYDARSGDITALNGSGRSPAALTRARVERDGFGEHLPAVHALTVTVPGACAAWCDLIERHGSLAMADVLAPAIDIADDGFPVAPITAYFWQLGATTKLTTAHGGHQLLIDGRAPAAGELIRNRALADTMRAISTSGPAAFYRGDLAARIARAVTDAGGVLAEADLAAHESTWDQPIATEFAGARVWECPPNGQGLTALLALNILRHCDVSGTDPLGPARLHLVIEALRLAFADARYYVADPQAAHVPVDALLSDDYARARAASIDPARATADVQRGTPTGGSDTVYLCAVDDDGNACSLIYSNYMGFGTGIVPEHAGFSLQNRGASFDLAPDRPNTLGPGKRPYNTIIPGMLTRADGSLLGPFGVMGGFMQPQGHVQVVLGMLVDGLDPQAALDRPRVCLGDGAPTGPIFLEEGMPDDTLRSLADMGHTVSALSGHARAMFGRGQIIVRDPDSGVLCAGSDPRADGCALGY